MAAGPPSTHAPGPLLGVDSGVVACFATPIAVLPLPAEAGPDLRATIDGEVDETPVSDITWKDETAPDLHVRHLPAVDRLTAYVLHAVAEYVRVDAGVDDWRDAARHEADLQRRTFNRRDEAVTLVPDLRVAACWGNRYRGERADEHDWHFHPDTLVAAVAVVGAWGEVEGGELRFEDPRADRGVHHPGVRLGALGEPVRLDSRSRLVLFPGWLRHRVTAVRGPGLRYSVSYNVVLGSVAP